MNRYEKRQYKKHNKPYPPISRVLAIDDLLPYLVHHRDKLTPFQIKKLLLTQMSPTFVNTIYEDALISRIRTDLSTHYPHIPYVFRPILEEAMTQLMKNDIAKRRHRVKRWDSIKESYRKLSTREK